MALDFEASEDVKLQLLSRRASGNTSP